MYSITQFLSRIRNKTEPWHCSEKDWCLTVSLTASETRKFFTLQLVTLKFSVCEVFLWPTGTLQPFFCHLPNSSTQSWKCELLTCWGGGSPSHSEYPTAPSRHHEEYIIRVSWQHNELSKTFNRLQLFQDFCGQPPHATVRGRTRGHTHVTASVVPAHRRPPLKAPQLLLLSLLVLYCWPTRCPWALSQSWKAFSESPHFILNVHWNSTFSLLTCFSTALEREWSSVNQNPSCGNTFLSVALA